MVKNLEFGEGSAEDNERERIREVLERALEQGVRAELTVRESSGLRTNDVFIEDIEEHVVYVSDSNESPVMPLSLESITSAKLTNQS